MSRTLVGVAHTTLPCGTKVAFFYKGRTLTDKSASDKLYGEAGRLMAADDAILFLADARDVMVLRKQLTGIQHVPNYPWTLDLHALGGS